MIVERPEFRTELFDLIRSTNRPCPYRQAIVTNTFKVASNYRDRIIKRLNEWNEPVTVALDGWTNVSGTKITNILLLARSHAYYWKSVPNADEHNTAGTLSVTLFICPPVCLSATVCMHVCNFVHSVVTKRNCSGVELIEC